MPWEPLIHAVLAGIAASLACGLGIVPLAIPGLDPNKHRGVGYAVASGLMFAASVYNLILPGLNMDGPGWSLTEMLPVVGGILLGGVFLSVSDKFLGDHEPEAALQQAVTQPATARQATKFAAWGGRTGLLVFLAMTVHSIPEGVAVGTAYTSDAVRPTGELGHHLGPTMALAIAIHNIPEGLAVAIPLRSAGVSLHRCFWAAVITSVPQPIAAIPAVLLAYLVTPLMPVLMGFAAGAMIFLVVLELIPEALQFESPRRIAWAFLAGFCGMMLIQVAL